MTKQDCIGPLTRVGIEYEDAVALRRISMTLRNWFELECGNSDNYKSWAIERDGDEPDSKPYMVIHPHDGRKSYRHAVADREQGAIKRLKKIMAKYDGKTIRDGSDAHCPRIWPKLSYYIQGDPRGASLFILREGDVPAGEDVSAYYSRGVAVFK